MLRDSAGLPRATRRRAAAAAQAAEAAAAPDPAGEATAAPLSQDIQCTGTAYRSAKDEQASGSGSTAMQGAAPAHEEEESSSEEEMLVLEKVGPPPTAAARAEAHRARSLHAEATFTANAVQAIARRSRPERPAAQCPSRAEVIRTFVTTAASACGQLGTTAGLTSDEHVVASSATGQANWLAPCAAPRSEESLQKPTRAASSSKSLSSRATNEAVTKLLGKDCRRLD